jgi:excisionase family DNA binding protein
MNTFSPEFEKSLAELINKTLQKELNQLIPQPKKPDLSDTSGFVTKQQAIRYLNISLSGLNNYLHKGLIPKHRIGSRILIKKADLDNSIYLAR